MQGSVPRSERTAHLGTNLVPPRDGEYVLDTDASDTALGAILEQEQDGQLHVIEYASRSLTNAENCY